MMALPFQSDMLLLSLALLQHCRRRRAQSRKEMKMQ